MSRQLWEHFHFERAEVVASVGERDNEMPPFWGDRPRQRVEQTIGQRDSRNWVGLDMFCGQHKIAIDHSSTYIVVDFDDAQPIIRKQKFADGFCANQTALMFSGAVERIAGGNERHVDRNSIERLDVDRLSDAIVTDIEVRSRKTC